MNNWIGPFINTLYGIRIAVIDNVVVLQNGLDFNRITKQESLKIWYRYFCFTHQPQTSSTIHSN